MQLTFSRIFAKSRMAKDWEGLFKAIPEVGQKILGYVSNHDLGNCRETCHKWSMFIDVQQIAWNRIWAIQQSSEFGADMHPLLICALYGQNYVYHQLAKNEVDKNPAGMMGMTPLFFACQQVVKLYLKLLIHN